MDVFRDIKDRSKNGNAVFDEFAVKDGLFGLKSPLYFEDFYVKICKIRKRKTKVGRGVWAKVTKFVFPRHSHVVIRINY